MNSFLGHSGVCESCQRFDHLWVPSALCDRCHTVQTVRDNFAADPALASRIYAAASAEDYLRRERIID